MSKRFFKSFLSSLLALLMIVSLAAVPSSAASISLSKTSMSLTKGYSTTLKVSGTSSKVSWSTGDKTIATVSSKGKVVGKSVGTTYIYAKVSGTTLKCKVNVVAGKITVGKSNVTLDVGSKTTVTVTALGTHVISATSTDKSVVKATWNGAKFDGNKIKLTLTAMGEGTARVKVYAKNYSSTVYKYINVTVEGDSLSDDDTTGTIGSDKITIIPGASSVTVNAAEKGTVSVFSSSVSSLGVVSSDPSVVSASITSTSGNNAIITVTGLKEGSAFIRIYNKRNVKNYEDVAVVVKSGAYYVLLDKCPTKSGTDQVIQVNTSTGTKYMLVPGNYDPAYANTMIAKQTNTYQYYTLYTEYPSKKAATDIIETVTPYTNSSDSSKWSLQRYIIKPQSFDQAAVDTAISAYTSEYKYYTIYNKAPTKQYATDEVISWVKYIVNPSTNKTEIITRYLLIPYGMSNSDLVKNIKENDSKDSAATYYLPITTFPTKVDASDLVYTWLSKNGTATYMLVPKNFDFLKRNDAIQKNMNAYCYYNWYSTAPTVKDATKEEVISLYVSPANGTSKIAYMLVKKNDPDREKYIANAYTYDSNGGIAFNNIPQ